MDGYAVGAGFELALYCDLRVIEEDAIMGFFGRRFNFPSLDGGPARLAKLIGLSPAMDLVLTGRGLTGKEAFNLGLASRLVPIGCALGQAQAAAATIAKFPQESLRFDRKCLYQAVYDAKNLDESEEYVELNAPQVVNGQLIEGE